MTKATEIITKLKANNFEAFIVGGAVRDMILLQEPKDYDVFTDCPKEELLKLFPKAEIIGQKERQAKIFTIIENGVEISQFRSQGDRLA